VLQVVDRYGRRVAFDEEVQPTTHAIGMPFVLSEVAIRAGDQQLVWHDASYPHTTIHAFLQHWMYRDRSLVDRLRPGAWTALGLVSLGWLVAIPVDVIRSRERRQGRRLKGPELVSAARFNRRLRADGVGFRQSRARGRSPWVRVPRAIESSHFLIVGDSGTGKSALIRQLLQQLDVRGETAIVYDPALEYTGQFYTPARGDRILNPLDARSPFWSPGDEWRHEAETLTLATSLFPDRYHDHTFFTDAPRRIFAHLLTFRPTPQELAAWLCHPVDIDARVTGTPYAAMIDPQAPAQRAGVLASLNMVADTLKLLPAEGETAQRWSAATWSTTRTGWLFLTSTPETRPRLVPLTSLWLDTLVLRLMNQGQPHPRRTWFVLDELASLQRLPQLHTAITENRKSNNPVVLGFQGRSQLETRYGHDAEAMLSQPATKIFLRTSEPHAAKWIADSIGEVETERLRESRSSGPGRQQTYGLERHVEPLVMASEISGLPALRGYLKVGNLLVRLSFPFERLPARAVPFQERARSTRGRGPASLVSTDLPGRPDERAETNGRHQDHRQQHVHDLSIE
jgi:type IV secretory pathway TraG/TraD family ATPase VirD4